MCYASALRVAVELMGVSSSGSLALGISISFRAARFFPSADGVGGASTLDSLALRESFRLALPLLLRFLVPVIRSVLGECREGQLKYSSGSQSEDTSRGERDPSCH
jgi:hypothetical protein